MRPVLKFRDSLLDIWCGLVDAWEWLLDREVLLGVLAGYAFASFNLVVLMGFRP